MEQSKASAYAERRAQRVERLRARAARLAGQADAASARAREIADRIPLGQPALVGHHSQRRHERDVERIQAGFGRAVALRAEAVQATRRADAVERNDAISGDDPDALDKLRAKLEAVEGARARMVAANRLVRAGDREGLAGLGFTAAQVAELLTPDFAGRLGFPDYALRNAAGEASRLRKRIVDLEARAAAPARATVVLDGGRIEEGENRVRVFFDERPTEALRARLKASGFRWAPSVGAWQRHASEAAWAAARTILGTTQRTP